MTPVEQAYSIGIKLACNQEGMEKTAFPWGAIGRGIMKFLPEFGAAAKTVGGEMGSDVMAMGKGFGGGIWNGLKGIYKTDLGKSMVQGGVFQGGMNALQADPGDRTSAFARGFAMGAPGGALGHFASKSIEGGLKPFNPTGNLGRLGKWALPHAAGMSASGLMPTGAQASPPPNPMTFIPRYY